jgi:hypothetical protein
VGLLHASSEGALLGRLGGHLTGGLASGRLTGSLLGTGHLELRMLWIEVEERWMETVEDDLLLSSQVVGSWQKRRDGTNACFVPCEAPRHWSGLCFLPRIPTTFHNGRFHRLILIGLRVWSLARSASREILRALQDERSLKHSWRRSARAPRSED